LTLCYSKFGKAQQKKSSSDKKLSHLLHNCEASAIRENEFSGASDTKADMLSGGEQRANSDHEDNANDK
jgi:hypothetical protein